MTELIEVNVATLSGPALDWAVAQIQAVKVSKVEPHYGRGWRVCNHLGFKYSPSTDWVIGGPLIEKYKLDIGAPMENGSFNIWVANTEWGHPLGRTGPTALIAACRAIVAAKLGDTVQVPKELI